MNIEYSFEHLLHMSDENGLFEHAEYQSPRHEHGYCVDDIARGLVTISREERLTPELETLAFVYLKFINEAQTTDGRTHNRMNVHGVWTDRPGLDDCWGRSLWALGSAAARVPDMQYLALASFERAAANRSLWLHALCFAGLGAAEVLSFDPLNLPARRLLRAAAERVLFSKSTRRWPWPERRLRYANGAIPQVLILAGDLLQEPQWLEEGLLLLAWLAEVETFEGHISVTPVGGWAPNEPRPGFDQQPIEVASLADACRSAFDITHDFEWLKIIQLCAEWFDGNNDSGIPMSDDQHSFGFDGLHQFSCNQNSGSESTLAMLSTFQHLKSQLVTL